MLPGKTRRYSDRIEVLRSTKMAQTAEKQQEIGSMDHDDWALILPHLTGAEWYAR